MEGDTRDSESPDEHVSNSEFEKVAAVSATSAAAPVSHVQPDEAADGPHAQPDGPVLMRLPVQDDDGRPLMWEKSEDVPTIAGIMGVRKREDLAAMVSAAFSDSDVCSALNAAAMSAGQTALVHARIQWDAMISQAGEEARTAAAVAASVRASVAKVMSEAEVDRIQLNESRNALAEQLSNAEDRFNARLHEATLRDAQRVDDFEIQQRNGIETVAVALQAAESATDYAKLMEQAKLRAEESQLNVTRMLEAMRSAHAAPAPDRPSREEPLQSRSASPFSVSFFTGDGTNFGDEANGRSTTTPARNKPAERVNVSSIFSRNSPVSPGMEHGAASLQYYGNPHRQGRACTCGGDATHTIARDESQYRPRKGHAHALGTSTEPTPTPAASSRTGAAGRSLHNKRREVRKSPPAPPCETKRAGPTRRLSNATRPTLRASDGKWVLLEGSG